MSITPINYCPKKCGGFFNLIFVIAKEESLNFYKRRRGFK